MCAGDLSIFERQSNLYMLCVSVCACCVQIVMPYLYHRRVVRLPMSSGLMLRCKSKAAVTMGPEIDKPVVVGHIMAGRLQLADLWRGVLCLWMHDTTNAL